MEDIHSNIQKFKPKALRTQLEFYGPAEKLISELGAADDKRMQETFRLLIACGACATEEVQFVRGADSRSQPFGRVTGIDRCLNPGCPYCNPEMVAHEQERLYTIRGNLARTDALQNTTTYHGSITCGHREGDSIPGLVKLLKHGHHAMNRVPGASQLIVGGFFSVECTTGMGKVNGAHPHISFVYTLAGTDWRAHQTFFNDGQIASRNTIEMLSPDIIGSQRTVKWGGNWCSCDGEGLDGFYGRNSPDWDIIQETTNGFAKNGGQCSALTPKENAEFILALKGTPLILSVGCWSYQGDSPAPSHQKVIASLTPRQWNQFTPEAKRILRTVVMDTQHWTDAEASEYGRLATAPEPLLTINSNIHARFEMDRLTMGIPRKPGSTDDPLPTAG